MWAFTFTCALLAASQIHAAAVDLHDVQKRDRFIVKENVLVTEQIAVVKQLDGTEVIGQPTPVATSVSLSEPVLEPEENDVSAPQELVTSNLSETPVEPESVAVIANTHDDFIQPEIALENTSNLPNSESEPVKEPLGSDKTVSGEDPLTSNESTNLNEESPTPSITPSNEDVVPEPVKQQVQVSDSTLAGENASHSKAAASRMAKRGIAYNDVSKLSVFTTSSKVSWAYNWGSSTPPIANNVEYVPMLWGTGAHAEGWTENANKALASGSTHLLAFNEPDLGAQSSLSVGEAVAGYQQLMQPYAGKARLGSPAVTNGGAPMGLSYLQSFITACSGCQIDFVAIHWYNGGNAGDFKNYVTKAHEVSGGRPVWITEFEGPGDAGQQQAFLAEVLPWLDNQDFVERYAYFMASDGNMISSGLTPSAVGQAFAFSN